jgi:hypothetical protein
LPLAALLIVGDVALPRLLGTDTIEFQLRRAQRAGARHAVIYAVRTTSPLLASVDCLRREGMSVDVARSLAEVAEYVHPHENLLMIAPDVIVSPRRMTAIAASDEPMLLCVRDEPANDRFELIDPTARWTGVARIDGGLLRRTIAMVGDWDLGSTLMRRAVQEGAARMTLTPDEAGADLIVLDGSASAQSAGRRLVASYPVENAGWATRWLITPAARLVARTAGDFGIEAQWLTFSGFGLTAIAVACGLAGWIVASLLFLLAGLLCDLAGSIATHSGAGTLRWEKYRFPVRAVAASVVVLALGITLTLRSAQWGCLLLASIIIGATWLGAPLARDDGRLATWRSDPAGHALIGLFGFAVAAPIAALFVCAVHSVFSLGWAMRKAVSGLARS